MVVKRDGRREVFSKEKLTSSLQRACQKRPVSEDDIAGAVERFKTGWWKASIAKPPLEPSENGS
jgi:transcriptional repressor NrdR